MLNDVLSLCVGLWAVKVAHQKNRSKSYTYGWQRAETLGALVNGVFLVALCLSIFLEAIQRFIEPQTVSNPKLVLIVGCFGLLSNVLGLFLFHEHGHSHGGGGHDHSHAGADSVAAAEEGHNYATTVQPTEAVSDETGNVADVLPQSTVAGWPKSSAMASNPREGSREEAGRHSDETSRDYTKSDEEDSTIANSSAAVSRRKSYTSSSGRRRRHNSGVSRARIPSVDEINIHPASFRKQFISTSRLKDIDSNNGSDAEEEAATDDEDQTPTETTHLLPNRKINGSGNDLHDAERVHRHKGDDTHDTTHTEHEHNVPGGAAEGSHSHSDLNMRGVFLHVMGDALGNIGVIGSALFIWLTNFSWRFYSDPAISLIITMIILGSAIPLCKAASRILLQGVPAGISVDAIQRDIQKLPGILSCHHLHVWQLSDVKLIASLHVQVEYDLQGEGSARYMHLAREVRRCLHDYGIHSSTIQPEFCLDSEHRHTSGSPSDNEGSYGSQDTTRRNSGSKKGSRATSLRNAPEACLLDCADACGESSQCCAPNVVETETHNENEHSH